LFAQRVVEPRLTVETIKICTDELTVLHAKTGLVDEIRYAARGVDLIIRAAGGSRFRLDNLNAILECLLYDKDAG
jgi:hypothetical protein